MSERGISLNMYNHDQRESGSERPFSFASFLFLRDNVQQARKKRNSNRLRGSSRCGIWHTSCELSAPTGTKGATGFLYAWRERQAARLREALMLLTSGSESYRAADAEALQPPR